MPVALHTILFRARPSTGEIEDFDILYMSSPAEDFHNNHHDKNPATLLKDLPSRAAYFNTYKQAAHNGVTLTLEITASSGGKKKPIRCTISGNNGHILESWEYLDEPAEEFQPRKNEGKTGLIKTAPVAATLKIAAEEDSSKRKENDKKIRDLNRELISKNRELKYLNSEFRAFSSIASNDYKEALKKMYTSLEFIITHDAAMLSNEGKANLRRVQSGIQKMKLLTEDIISFSSLEALPEKQEWVNLNEYLEQVKNVVSGQMNKGDDIVIECERLEPIKGYPTMLYLLFYHLLDNAVKFRSSGRNLTIRIECSRINGLYINHADASPDTFYDHIRIADNGIGFEQEFANKIFSMFYRIEKTNKFKGSGTGLAFCRKIMQLHDGFINAEGYPDKGAVFNCYFPYETEG
ncbi:MAG: histidine kinase [Chitinophagaceae bacterium]|nr:histidine kinase [Chitinophagaceae bacterium]